MRRRRIAAILALLAFAAITQGADSCSSTDNGSSTTGESKSPPAGSEAPTPGTTEAPTPPANPQTFRGIGEKALGTIVVHTDSTLSWNCPSCGDSNFIINNADSDDVTMPTNGLNQTRGVDNVSAGTYHNVVVKTEAPGPWTIRIAPG
jgi:hypothetical protein